MLLLQFQPIQNRWFVWGEKPSASSDSANGASKRGRQATTVKLRPHPRAVSPLDLATALALANCESLTKVRPKTTASLTAHLPVFDGSPLASSPIIEPPPELPPETTLDSIPRWPWMIPAIELTIDQALELLFAANERNVLASGVIVGPTLSYWAQAARFAAGLVARQRLLPGLLKVSDQQGLAIWEPFLDGPDSLRSARLAKAAPPACLEFECDGVTAAENPAQLLNGFVQSVVDHLARSSHQTARSNRAGSSARNYESVHDHWLGGLSSPSGVINVDELKLVELLGQIQQWRRRVRSTENAPFRLCFRIEEPNAHVTSGDMLGPDYRTNAKSWFVRFLFQAADDPSLLIPVDQAWANSQQYTPLLNRPNFQPKEYALASLGQASSICPHVEQGLRASQPRGFEINDQGASEFLHRDAWLLEQAGFGVMLPSWWTRKGSKNRVVLRAKVKTPKMKSQSFFTLADLLEFEWEVAIGNMKLTLAELRRLANSKTGLVQIRGQWVHVNSEDIQTALSYWEKHGNGKSQATARDLLLMGLGAGLDPKKMPQGLDFEGVLADGWIDNLLKELTGEQPFETQTTPEGFLGTLRPYQTRGYSWLSFLKRWSFGACLADDMGLGKTIQTLALLQQEWESRPNERRPTLLVCPMSVVGNWQREAAKFTPNLPVMMHHGSDRPKGDMFIAQANASAVVLTSYPLLSRDTALFKKVKWFGVILDEAQNIKNPVTKQSQSARELESDFRIALTGTPVENHVGDLWAIMEFLNPGLLGSQKSFKEQFWKPIQVHRDEEVTQRLKRLTGPFLLRRLKTDKSIIADLPDKIEQNCYCNLTKEQAALYEATITNTRELIKNTQGFARKGLVLSLLTRLKQVCNHPAQYLHDNSPIPNRSGKLNRLIEMLSELEETGDYSLVFTQFAEMGEMLHKHLQETFGREVLFLHGGIAKHVRDRMVTRFQFEEDGPRIFILTVKAGGTGLNLVRANHVFHFDRWWNPAVENQATDRAFRIGQNKKVQVHKFVCTGTLEEQIDQMIASKQAVAGSVIGTGEEWLTNLSDNDLMDVLRLRKDAVDLD